MCPFSISLQVKTSKGQSTWSQCVLYNRGLVQPGLTRSHNCLCMHKLLAKKCWEWVGVEQSWAGVTVLIMELQTTERKEAEVDLWYLIYIYSHSAHCWTMALILFCTSQSRMIPTRPQFWYYTMPIIPQLLRVSVSSVAHLKNTGGAYKVYTSPEGPHKIG